MASSVLCDYFFTAGEFALFESAMNPFRVKILGETISKGNKYYIVAGPEPLMNEEALTGDTFTQYSEDDVPTGWIVDLLEPDDLSVCSRASHLRLV